METRALKALREDARLLLDEGACLPLRSRFGQCRRCESACPVRVISVSVDQVSLADGCTGCGRCTAACPTQALHVDGFDIAQTHADAGVPIEVECAKVPARLRRADTIVVPCLGGVTTGRLVGLHAHGAGCAVTIIDRGWCSTCKSGGGEVHPAQAALDAATLWLAAVAGSHEVQPSAPRLEFRPLDVALMPMDIPAAVGSTDPGPAMTRRQFLRSVAERPAARPRTPMGEPGQAAFPVRSRRPSPERGRLIDALSAVARRAHAELPPELFPRVTSDGACVDHRVCTAACPTGALQIEATDHTASLTFDATTCIACGACQRACPEGALSMEAHGGQPARVAVALHLRRTCVACGDAYTPRTDEETCPPCTKSRRFVGDAMTRLFSQRPEAAGE